MSASSLVGSVKNNEDVDEVDQGSDVDSRPTTSRANTTPVPSIRLNDIDLESDLVMSSDSDGLNASELNITTEDDELRLAHPEVIELSVLSSRSRCRSRTDHHHPPRHSSTRLQNHDTNVQPRSVAISVESEMDVENEVSTNQQLSSDLPSERMFRPSDIFLRSHTAASTTLDTTADTEEDLRMSANKRTVKTKKKKVRRSSASETDTIDTTTHIAANQRTHTGRRATRRAFDARNRHLDRAETRIIFAPFPFAIISDNRVGKDNEQLRRAIALNNVHVVSDEGDDDEGDVDDDNWNEKEDDEDDEHRDDESVASTCTSVPVTRQISSNIINPSSPSTTSSVSMATCRICFQPEEEDSILYHLVSPCLCEGTVKYMHQFCLNRWIAESGTSSCELCGYEFHLRTLSVANVFNWRPIELSHWERVHLALGLFSLLFVVISLVYMMWVTVSSNPQAVYTRESMTSEILFPIYACLDALTLCVCSYELSSTVKRLWRRWRATNSCLIVLDKPVKRRREPPLNLGESTSLTDVVATEESPTECGLEQILEDETEVIIHHELDEGDDDKCSASTNLQSSASHVTNGLIRHQNTINSDNCSATLSITNSDPLTSCSNLAIAGNDLDKMYVEHINKETMV